MFISKDLQCVYCLSFICLFLRIYNIFISQYLQNVYFYANKKLSILVGLLL